MRKLQINAVKYEDETVNEFTDVLGVHGRLFMKDDDGDE